jgi:acyl dehydratase
MTAKPYGAETLMPRVGQEIGHTAWLVIDQSRIDIFGEVTDDLEPLHNDPKWCAEHSPYGKPIAYGFLTLSLLTRFMAEITNNALMGGEGRKGFPLNYGFDRVRFVEPVAVGDRIRARMTLNSIEPRAPGMMLNFSTIVDIEGKDRPALAAEWISLWIDGADAIHGLTKA